MDIVVKGRNVEVPQHYRVHVKTKLSRLERYDRKIVRFDVELFHEPNRRQHKSCQRVEITTAVRGHSVRAEACASDFYAALDRAIGKVENRLRRLHDRRRVHHGRRCPTSVGAVAAGTLPDVPPHPARLDARERNGQLAVLERSPGAAVAIETVDATTATTIPQQRSDEFAAELPGQIVRVEEHPVKPMSAEEALGEMELVGHDFYLFADLDTGQPSVVYRRKGFHYGMVRLA